MSSCLQIEEATLVAQAGAEEEEKKKLSRRFNLSDRVRGNSQRSYHLEYRT